MANLLTSQLVGYPGLHYHVYVSLTTGAVVLKCLDETSPIHIECRCGVCSEITGDSNCLVHKHRDELLPLRQALRDTESWSSFEQLWMDATSFTPLPQEIHDRLQLYLNSPFGVPPLFEQTVFTTTSCSNS